MKVVLGGRRQCRDKHIHYVWRMRLVLISVLRVSLHILGSTRDIGETAVKLVMMASAIKRVCSTVTWKLIVKEPMSNLHTTLIFYDAFFC